MLTTPRLIIRPVCEQGLAFEACSALMSYAERELGAKLFTAGTALDNAPSMRLLERLGFELATTMQTAFHKDAQGMDISFESGIYLALRRMKDAAVSR